MEGLKSIVNVNLISAFNWYGFLIGGGMALCLLLAYFSAKKRGYYADVIFDIAIICIPLAIIGARLYYVVFDILGNGGKWTFKEIIGIGSGGLRGLAIYGGLIFAVLGAVIIHFLKHKKEKPQDRINLIQLLDLGFTFIILGQAIGRWGNFANQEAFGPKVDWHFFPLTVKIDASHATDGAGYYLATFFYESIWNFAGFFLLYWLYNGKRKSFDGFIFSVYCIYYGIGRAWIEGLRQDSLYGIMGLRVSQILSILMIIFGIAFIIFHLYKARENNKKPFIFVEQSLLNSDYYGYEQTILHHPTDYTKKNTKEVDFSDEFYSQADDGFENEDFYDDNSLGQEAEGEIEVEKAVKQKAVKEKAVKEKAVKERAAEDVDKDKADRGKNNKAQEGENTDEEESESFYD